MDINHRLSFLGAVQSLTLPQSSLCHEICQGLTDMGALATDRRRGLVGHGLGFGMQDIANSYIAF